MKRGKFTGIVFLTGFGLAGILALQVYWLQQAWNFKENEFDTAVMISLENVSQQVSQKQVVHILENRSSEIARMDELRSQRVGSIQGAKNHKRSDSLTIYVDNLEQVQMQPIPSCSRITLEQRSFEVESRLSSLEANAERLEMVSDELSNRLETALIPLENIGLDTVWEVTELLRSVHDSLIDAGIEKPMRMVEDMVSEIIIQTQMNSGDLDQDYTSEEFHQILANEFRFKKIDLPFDYKVYSDLRRENILHSANYNEKQLSASPYSIEVSGMVEDFNTLSIFFPGKRDFLLREMAGMIILSLGLSTIAVTGFVYLSRMLARQQKISSMKTQFINNMTHEFKTPLATTLVAATTLNHPKIQSDPEKIRYYTNLIKEENRIMNRQIETVLQAALLENHKLILKNERVDLRDVIIKAKESLQFQAEQKNASIHVHLPDKAAEINGDADHLQQTIANLLGNSLKYCKEVPEISIRLEEENDLWKIQIQDNGIGISKKDQKHIFEPFFRVNTGDLHDIKGFGLGLNYVRKIMEYHKGKILVKSEPGYGSTFTLIFQTHEL